MARKILVELDAWEATDMLQELIGFGAVVDILRDLCGDNPDKRLEAHKCLAELLIEHDEMWRQPEYARRHGRWVRHVISTIVAGLNDQLQLERIANSAAIRWGDVELREDEDGDDREG